MSSWQQWNICIWNGIKIDEVKAAYLTKLPKHKQFKTNNTNKFKSQTPFTSKSNFSITFHRQVGTSSITLFQSHDHISLRTLSGQYLAVTQKLISEHRDVPEDAKNNIMKEVFVQKWKQKSGSPLSPVCLSLQ